MKVCAAWMFVTVIGLCSCSETPLQRADNDFDVHVPHPAFTTQKPVVYFDEGHNNFHTTTGLYKPFAQLLKNDGYDLHVSNQPVTAQALAKADVFIIANAKGEGDLNDTPAFTPAETEVIKSWVAGGGSLLLIADHFPFGSAVQNLADQFQIMFQKGMVEDSVFYDTLSKDRSQLVFSTQNRLLGAHEITRGLTKVVTFTGQSFQCSDSCFSFLQLSAAAYDLQPKTTITRDGNDTRVVVTYENPTSARGRSQGAALRFGKGKVVVLGEAALLTAQKNRDSGKVGMNYNADNKQLALNIMHWLTKKE